MEDLCHEHSGCIRDIANLKEVTGRHEKELERVSEKTDRIFSRINVILGGIVIAIVMLLINITIKTV